jgi:hypothetical protein
MTTRVELIAFAKTYENDEELIRLVQTYRSLQVSIIAKSDQLSLLARLSKESVEFEDRSPSLNNTDLVTTAYELACDKKMMFETLFTIAGILEKRGQSIDW